MYDRVEADERVSWGRIPSIHTRLAEGVDAGDRSVHAKVYRFWRGGPDPLEVVVMARTTSVEPPTPDGPTSRCRWSTR